MKTRPQADRVAVFGSSFDAKVKEAICRVKGISYAEKLKLYNAILDTCRTQVRDCVDVLDAGLCLSLNQIHHFGRKRIPALRAHAQELIDGYAERYDIGMLAALYRDLRAVGIDIERRDEG